MPRTGPKGFERITLGTEFSISTPCRLPISRSAANASFSAVGECGLGHDVEREIMGFEEGGATGRDVRRRLEPLSLHRHCRASSGHR